MTPLGLHMITSGRRGLFGEVVSGLNKHKSMFNHIVHKGKEHWFVKSFGERPRNEKSTDSAEVVTDQYLLIGPTTDASRGIRIHGTNRSGELHPDGKWHSFLGGVRRSGGCIRMSNVDIRDLHLSGYLTPATRVDANGDLHGMHTPILIFATDAARGIKSFPGDVSSYPPRWVPPNEAHNAPKPPESIPFHEKKLPKRWIPPE